MSQVIALFSTVSLILVSITLGCTVIVEKGQPASLECNFTNPVRAVTWRLNGTTAALTTCNFDTNNCTNVTPLYEGTIASSSTGNITRLNIKNASITSTVFECVPDSAPSGNVCALEVYAWPKKPHCTQTVANTYVDFVCTTENVYPGVNTKIHRRGEVDFSQSDLDVNHTNCVIGSISSGSEGDCNASCTYRVPIQKMISGVNVYIQMIAFVSNFSLLNRTPEVSNEVTPLLIPPEVKILTVNCPVGSGVRGADILIGTNATCKCELKNRGFPPGFARWENKYGQTIGDMNSIDGSSTLFLSYNYSDPNQSYKCWPQPPFTGIVTVLTYTPSFTSSAPHIVIMELQSLVIVLGAVCVGFVTRFH